jgi:hypothetical protein
MGWEAAVLQRYGYAPASQTYAEGVWGCGAWFLAFLALFLLVGIIILVYMAVNRPDGVLTVVYERRVPATTAVQTVSMPPVPDRATLAPPPSVRDRLGELDGLRADGLITDEEYAARRAAILESL